MMTTPTIKSASVPTLRRLAGYYHFLTSPGLANREYLSCTHIAEQMNSDPTQVRKDIEVTGLVGKPKVGYVLADLIHAIEEFLGWTSVSDAFLVGAGHLGMALLGYPRFNQFGLNIVAVFDTNPAKVGTKIQGRPVMAMEKLSPLVKRMHVPIGIITVPAETAQAVADVLVAGGIRAIWNFAPVTLDVPVTVIVENVSLASSLAVLTNRLARTMESGALAGAKEKKTP
jgi:redox-sensing transcriptional repressor